MTWIYFGQRKSLLGSEELRLDFWSYSDRHTANAYCIQKVSQRPELQGASESPGDLIAKMQTQTSSR